MRKATAILAFFLAVAVGAAQDPLGPTKGEPKKVEPKKDQPVEEPKPKRIQVIDFHAKWCGPCLKFGPTFEAWKEKYKDLSDVEFVKVDIDLWPDLQKAYKVQQIPTIIITDDRRIVKRWCPAPKEEDILPYIKPKK